MPKANTKTLRKYWLMIFTPKIFDFIPEDIPFENEPLVNLASAKEQCCKHEGYFKPMDTYREYLDLNNLWNSGKAPES